MAHDDDDRHNPKQELDAGAVTARGKGIRSEANGDSGGGVTANPSVGGADVGDLQGVLGEAGAGKASESDSGGSVAGKRRASSA